MRRGMTYSTILHLAVILIAFLGIPHLMRAPVEIEESIPVEVVTIAPKTNVPKVEAKPVEQPTPPKKAETPPAPPLPAPPKPAPEKSEVPPPQPTPPSPQPTPPVPEPLVAALPQQPPPQPKPEKKPEPPPEPAETRTPLVPTPPKAKPTPQVTVESILKSVEKVKPRAEPDQADKVVKELAQAPRPVTSSLDNKITASEIAAIIAAVRSQVERCWNIPAGAKDAKNLVVEIHLALNPDGTVREAAIVDQARMQSDGFFRTAAESARRAILLCQPLKLPPDKYSVWQEMTLSFNPSQIL